MCKKCLYRYIMGPIFTITSNSWRVMVIHHILRDEVSRSKTVAWTQTLLTLPPGTRNQATENRGKPYWLAPSSGPPEFGHTN